MPNLSKNDQRPGDPQLDPVSLTEQEHTDSCDINKMLGNLALGREVRGNSSQLQYGQEDMNMSALDFHIKKQKLEEELSSISTQTEFSEEELKLIPKTVQQKFKFKQKQTTKKPQTNDEKTSASIPPKDPSTP